MRKFAVLNLILALSMILSACATSVTPTTAPEATATTAMQAEATNTPAPAAGEATATSAPEATATMAGAAYGESPMLADQAKAGTIPPVEERLPETPAVVAPVNEVGKYGGDLRMGFTGTNPGWGGLWFVVGWENLVIWKPDFSGVVPNIAEKWEVSPDVTTYTFYLRKGMKWSDGEPFTADDIMFYINDVLFDPDVSPAGPVADWLPKDSVEGFKVEKVDDYTVKFIFPKPQGTFLYNLATWSGRHITWFPKHYLMQFHKKYNPNVDELVAKEEGVQDWVGLFNKYAAGPSDDTQNFFLYPQRPTLHAWIVDSPLGTGTQITLKRNPYYWKVDTEGNQLPYIDTVTGISYQDAESRTFAMLNGDIDYVKDPGEENRIVYYDAKDEGKPIEINSAISDGGVTNTIHFNRTLADPVKAEIFANKDFRIGMSYAINRQEIIDIVHNGQGTPSQAAPLESSPLYNEQLATQYVEYDVAKANEYLDKVLPNKDSEGMRLDKNGKRLSIVFTVSNDLTYGTTWVQIAQLLTGYWKDAGVEVKLNSIPDTQFVEAKKANTIEATMYTGEGGAGITAILDPRYYIPAEYFGLFGNGWFYWRTNDATGTQVEMPQELQDLRTKFDAVLGAPSPEEQISRMKEVIQDAADQFYVIGIARPGPGYQPYNKRIANLPAEWIAGWIEGVQKIKYPEQWYINE